MNHVPPPPSMFLKTTDNSQQLNLIEECCWIHFGCHAPELSAYYVTFWGHFNVGDRYVVVDCGGGTVDLTVHQIRLPEGHLKELYKASGTTTSHDTSNEVFFLSCFIFIPNHSPFLSQAVPTALLGSTMNLRSSCVRSLARISLTSLRSRGQPLGWT